MSFYEKFKPNEFTLKEFNHWIVLLRQKQITLGDAVIILKEENESIGKASGESFAELPTVISWFENKCISLFDAEKFNYIAAMMKDNFVHFHAIPRYSKEINYNGTLWKDDLWPRPISLIDIQTDDIILKQLLNDMKD